MRSLKDSPFFHDAIHEINYTFGDFYLFDKFVVGEVREGITFTWEDQGKKLVEDISYLYESKGEDIVLISNRINSYSVKPTDWIKFYKHKYLLKGYGVVSYSKIGNSIALLEKLFNHTKTKQFKTLETAIEWAKGLTNERMVG